jgi:O-antigen ligase
VSSERLAFSSGSISDSASTDARAKRRQEPKDNAPTHSRSRQAAMSDGGYTGLLVFTALLLVRPQDQIPALAPLHLAEVAAIAACIPMIWNRLSRGLSPLPMTRETVLLFAFGLVIIATVPFSIWPGGALNVFTDSYAKALMIYLLMVSTLTTTERLERFVWLILVCIGYVAVRGVLNYARGINLVEDDRMAGPVSGIFGNPNDLALNMVTFLPVVVVVVMSRWYSAPRRALAAFIALLMVAAVVFSKSRGGMIGLVVMLAALQFLARKISPRAGIAAVVALVLVLPLAPASFWDRMASITNARQDQEEFTGSREARRILIEEALNTFVARPFTGVGAGQFKNYNPPERTVRWRETHNVVLQVAAETGVFGLASFLGLLACGATGAARTKRWLSPPRRRSAPDPAGEIFEPRERQVLYGHAVATAAGLIGWFTCALFASVAYSWTLYYLLGLIVSAREIVRNRMAVSRDTRKGAAA